MDQKTGRTFSLGNNETRQDPYFWHGEPIWNTATRQGVKTGVVYWPGSDVKIGGHFPTYYHNYLQKPLLTFAERVAEVTRYLRLPDAERPELVLAYFEEPDHSGHTYGPMAPETRQVEVTMRVYQLHHSALNLSVHQLIANRLQDRRLLCRYREGTQVRIGLLIQSLDTRFGQGFQA